MNDCFVQRPSDAIAEEVEQWFGFLDSDSIKINSDEFYHLVSGADNIAVVSAESDTFSETIVRLIERAKDVAKVYDFFSAEAYIIQMAYAKDVDMRMDSLGDLNVQLLTKLSANADIMFGLTKNEASPNRIIKIVARNLKKQG